MWPRSALHDGRRFRAPVLALDATLLLRLVPPRIVVVIIIVVVAIVAVVAIVTFDRRLLLRRAIAVCLLERMEGKSRNRKSNRARQGCEDKSCTHGIRSHYQQARRGDQRGINSLSGRLLCRGGFIVTSTPRAAPPAKW